MKKAIIILLLSNLYLGIYAQTLMNIYKSDGSVLQIPLGDIDSINYTIPNPGNLATISTTIANNISTFKVVSGGNVLSNGGTPITSRGVCWSLLHNPTTANSKTIDGSGPGLFISNILGLSTNTTYYCRAYAVNSAGTSYGNEISFTTTSIISNPGNGVLDIDGTSYPTIVLGNGQEWMAKNLRVSRYSNGDSIPNLKDTTLWLNNFTTQIGAWVNLENRPYYDTIFGKLYSGYAVSDSRNVCPIGWHVPSNTEWAKIFEYVGGADPYVSYQFKSKSTSYPYQWRPPNNAPTNDLIGFSAYPGGSRQPLGDFSQYGTSGFWWASTPQNSGGLGFYGYSFINTDSYVYNIASSSRYGYSIRCVKD